MEETSKKSVGLWRWLTGGVPLVAVLTAAFYLEGRAYLRGFADYFYIDSSQMTNSTADVMWAAYRGWSNGAARVLLGFKETFWFFISQEAVTVLAIFIVGTVAAVAHRYGLWKRLWWRRADSSKASLFDRVTLAKIPAWFKRRVLFICLLASWTLLALPVGIFVAAFAVVVSLVFVVAPFGIVGKLDAEHYCDMPAAAVPMVVGLPEFDPRKGDVHLLWCAVDTCAVLQEGRAATVPKQAIKKIVSAPVAWEPPSAKGEEYVHLCVNRDQLHASKASS